MHSFVVILESARVENSLEAELIAKMSGRDIFLVANSHNRGVCDPQARWSETWYLLKVLSTM